jgi:hypothetical protein
LEEPRCVKKTVESGEEADFIGAATFCVGARGATFNEKEEFGQENDLARGDPSWPPFHEG